VIAESECKSRSGQEETVSNESADCPEMARLRRFLEGPLPEADVSIVASHVENCPECRAQLVRWNDDPAYLTGASRPDDQPSMSVSPSFGVLLERIKMAPHPTPASGQETDTHEPRHGPTADQRTGNPEGTTLPEGHSIALDFVSPSDRAGSLGRIGPYEVLGQIGHGGMGVVLKALDPRLNRIVAIKVLMPGLASNTLARRRFTREAQAAAAVCHEHVVTIHAVDEAGGQPYLVMQLVAGQSLQEKINRSGPLGLEKILRIGMQIASGLAAAHAQGLVHRDIKPANILLENGVERVKITDFGLARAIDDASLTASGTIIGTPHYMSPEQARAEPIDYRTDVFSLGSVLYAMCTGQPPFLADTTVAVLRKVSDDPPRPIRELNPEVPDWLVAIVAKLMAKDPAGRYQTVQEVAEVLARHLAELQHPARPALAETSTFPSLAPPATRAGRRRGLIALVLASGILVVVTGLAKWWEPRSRNFGAAPNRDAARSASPEPRPAVENQPSAAAVTVAAARRQALERIAAGDEEFRRAEFQKAADHFTEAIHLDPSNPDGFLKRAGVYAANGVANWVGVIADATEALRLDPKNAEAYDRRADAYRFTGEFRHAVDDATEALRLDPERAWPYAVRGCGYTGLSQYDHAIVDLNEYVRRRPKNPWGFFFRGSAYQSQGDLDHALKDLHRAIELDRNASAFWMNRGQIRIYKGDLDGGFADLSQALQLGSRTDKYRTHIVRGDAEFSLSMIDPAIADYTEAIRLNRKQVESQDHRILGARGSLYLARGDVDRALGDLDLLIRFGSTSASTYFNRGLAHIRTKQFDRAIADFERGSKVAGKDKAWTGACLVGRGDGLLLAGRIEQAEAAYQECIKFDPNRGYAGLESHAWLIDRPRGDYDAALKKLDQIAKGGWIIPYLLRGLIYARKGMPDKALADFAEVMKRVEKRKEWFSIPDYFPRRLGILIGRGEAYLLKGDLDRALAESDEAARFAPWSAEARSLRAQVHSRRGKTDLAEADNREAQRLTPDPLFARP
jgi:serine/threonine protein kinase/Tfp pilus assembly protein PilF